MAKQACTQECIERRTASIQKVITCRNETPCDYADGLGQCFYNGKCYYQKNEGQKSVLSGNMDGGGKSVEDEKLTPSNTYLTGK